MKSDSIIEYRKLFPALDQGIYADTAATGLMYEQLFEWRRRHDIELQQQASALWPEHNRILDGVRKSARRFFSASDAEVALLPNFSLGLNLLLENMDRKTGVILVENDYPSVNWPFEQRNFQIFYVRPDQSMENQILDLLRSRNIGILALSLIQWLNGVKIETDFLKAVKREFPSLIIIADGTQYCGAHDLNFSDSGIDLFGTSGYKWLLGGYGNGLMLISKSISSRINVSAVGFNSAEGDLRAKDRIPLYKQLEPGHLDSLNFGSLMCSLDFLSSIGMDRIESHNRSLSEKALKGFGNLGLLEEEVLLRNGHGTIFRLVAKRKLFEYLLKKGVRCSWRADGIRLSFHFYNTEQEIDRIIEIIKKAI